MKPNWFVAFPVHSGPWFSPLFTGLPRGIRQFHPVDLHITVAFLGAVSEEAAQAGFQALPEDLGGAVSATLGRMRGMGNRRRPSAYALTLEVGREGGRRAHGQLAGGCARSRRRKTRHPRTLAAHHRRPSASPCSRCTARRGAVMDADGSSERPDPADGGCAVHLEPAAPGAAVSDCRAQSAVGSDH